MKAIFTGGGTGGHIFPIIAVARELTNIYLQKTQLASGNSKKENLELFYLGPKSEIGPEAEMLLKQEGIKIKYILAGKLRRYFGIEVVFQNIIDIFKTPIGILQSFSFLFWKAPDLIFSKGGYGSFPVVFSGKLLGIPIFLHESDIEPGLANKKIGKYASIIFISFPNTGFFPAKKMVLSGNPIRRELLEGSIDDAKKLFQLTSSKPVILIIGGSQGAQKINDLVLNILPKLLENFEIIHQTGSKNFKEVESGADVMINKDLKKYYHPFPFLEEKNLKHALAVCDLIVSRAGSGSIFEIAALEKPSILIPLSGSAQNHQIKNAYAYAENRAAIVMEEISLTPHFFLQTIKNILENQKEMENIKKAAKNFSKPDAAKKIANYIMDYLYQ